MATVDGTGREQYTGDLNTATSLNDIVDYYNAQNKWIENPLDVYHSYTYNLEFFIVDQKNAVEFLINEQSKLEQVATDGWPSDDIKSITIAATGTTTEFNIQDLQVESLGPGSTSTSKLVGSATKLSFSIVQVGNTSLNDSLMNVALLSGYTSIAKATYFLKIKFKGFDENGVELTTDKQHTTKVLPFVINNVGDVPTSTDARGTVTTIEGTIAIDRATTTEVDIIEDPFDFEIKDTLQETLVEFKDTLNEIVAKNNYADDDQFINMYEIEFDKTFTEGVFAQSAMNGPSKDGGVSSTDVKTRTNSLNLSKQVGNVTTGLSIINILYDICIQSLEVRKELTSENDGFTKVINITTRVAPKKDGLNVLTGKSGHWVKYFIGFKETLVAQNKIDEANKVSHAAKIAKRTFEKDRCRKIYYYQYTGLNDQVLDLQLSFNRQLVKAFVRPNDAYFYKKFLDGASEIVNELNPKAKERLNELRTQIETNTKDINDARLQVQTVKDQIEANQSDIDDAIDQGAADIVSSLPTGEAEMTAGDLEQQLKGKTIQEQLQVIRQYDPDFQLQGDLLDSYNRLGKQLDDVKRALGNQTTEQKRLEDERAEVYQESIGAELSKKFAENRDSLSGNLERLNITDDIVLMEELGDEFITTLTAGQFEALLETLQYNPTVFTTQVLPKLEKRNITVVFTSSNAEDVEQARQKFYEGVNLDISMQQLDMTIKGDPFWIDTYQIPEYIRDTFNGNNINESFPHHPSDLESANYVIIVTNKAAGVDENDNLKIANLQTMLYAVKSITSSFSGGQFTQQLNMVKIPTPSNFKQLNPTFGPIILDDSDYITEAFGHLGGGSQRPTYGTGDGTDPDAGDPRGNQVGNGNTVVPISSVPNPNNLPVGAGSVAVVDENGNVGIQLSADGAPGAANSLNLSSNKRLSPTEATRVQDLINQNQYYCEMGLEANCIAIDNAYRNIITAYQLDNESPEGMVEILNSEGTKENLSPQSVSLIQDALEKQGVDGFSADDLDNPNLTQDNVDFARKEADDAAASYYIGTNGVVENPIDAMTDMETGGRFGEASAKDMLNGEDPYVSDGFERRMYVDQTGRAPRSIDVDVDPKTLTPSEYEKVSEMNAEIAEITNGKSLYELTDAEWERVQQLENGINEISDASTSGVRGQVRDEVIDKEKRERISNLQDEREHLTDDLDGWYWTQSGRNEDEEQLAKVEQQLLAEQSTAQPTVITDVQRIPNAQGEVEIVPVHTLKPIEDQPIIVPKTDPLPETYIDNRDGTITVLAPPSMSDTIPEYAGMNEKQAREMSGARSIYNGIYEQIEDLPTVEDSMTLDTGEVLTWENPDFSKLQEVEYVDANGETKTFDPSTVNWNTDGGWTPENQGRMMTTIADEFDDVNVSSAGTNNEVRGNVFSIDAPEENEEE